MTASPSTYLLDANVFIEARKGYYAFEICPGFWDALIKQHELARIGSIDRVRDELGHEELTKWAAVAPSSCFASSDEGEVLKVYAELQRWAAAAPQFTPEAKAEFAEVDNADPWLIAYAKVRGMTLVTHETYDAAIKRRIKIPNACLHVGVQWVNTFEMLRALGVKFALSAAPNAGTPPLGTAAG